MTSYVESVDARVFVDRALAKWFGGRPSEEAVISIASAGRDLYHAAPFDQGFVERRFAEIALARDVLAKLNESPGIAQRTPEWYATRRELITASDFGQALGSGKFGTAKGFFAKKCGYEPDAPFNALIPPLKWGVMFEPVANELYCLKNGLRVHEFGLLRHPAVPYLGASPDGINDLGVMVEIKCPFKRKIDGTIPSQYYHQIQGQLEVCGLTECDYLECEFACVDADEEDCGGLIAEFRCEDRVSYDYFYCHRDADPAAWEQEQRARPGFYALHRWRLVTYRCTRVYKDATFVDDMMNKLGETWAKIERYRADKAAYVKEIGDPASSSSKRQQPQVLSGWSFIED
jgi:putative phage-type endonuclease